MNNDRIHEIAEKYQDGQIAEGTDLIGYEFSLNSIIAFARAIATEQREIDAKIVEGFDERYRYNYGAAFAAAIRNQKVEE